MHRVLATAALATIGAFGTTEAEAHADVQWSVTIGSPFYAPAPVYWPAPVYRAPAPARGHGYHQPQRWDRDGDGIPNRHDRLYNPRWDRDGDGIPNRHDRHPYGGHGWQGGHNGGGWQGGHNGGSWNDGRGGDQRGHHDGRGGQGGRERHDARPGGRGY